MDQQGSSFRDLLQHAETVSPRTHEIDIHNGVGKRDTALIEPLEKGNRYFVKYYSPTSEAYNEYPGRSILFDINTESWDGDEPPGAGQYEYVALRQVTSELDKTKDSIPSNLVIPEPMEYVQEHNALILSYIDERENLRTELFPYARPALSRQFWNGSMEITNLATELAVNIRAIHERTETGDIFDMSSYLSAHELLLANSTLQRSHPEILDQLAAITSPTLPVCYSHGDFIPRNILRTTEGKLSFIDWNLFTVAHPFLDVHRFDLDLWRWSFFPLSNTNELNRIRNTFVETYLAQCETSYYGYIFTKITALLRFYYLFIYIHSGIKPMIYQRMRGDISKEIDRCLEILLANGSP
jgi:hypothetical protein